MEKHQLKSAIEALIFASPDSLTPAQIKRLLKAPKETAVVKEEEIEAVAGEEAAAPEGDIESSGVIPAPELAVEAPANEEDVDALSQLKQVQEEMESEISIGDIKQLLGEIKEEYDSRPDHGFELVVNGGAYQFRTKASQASYVRNLVKLPKPRLSAPSMETLAVVAYQQPITRQKVEDIRGVDSGGVLKTLLDRDLVRVVGRSEEAGRPILYGTTQGFLETFGLISLSELPSLSDLESLEGGGFTGSDSEPSEAIEGEAPDGLGPFGGGDASPYDGEPYFQAEDDSLKLIDDLENSLHAIKDLETRIFPKPQAGESEPVQDPQQNKN